MNNHSSHPEMWPLNLRRSLGKFRAFLEFRWALALHRTDWLLRRRFNRWAKWGRGESMEQHHTPIAEMIWEKMELGPKERILELGCGEGWACRLMAQRAGPESHVLGLDISDEMIRRAREKSRGFSNVDYHCGSAQQIPGADNSYSKVVSIEAFYYFEWQSEVLRELFRVMKPGGQLYLLICLYQEDPKPKDWYEDIGMPVQNRSMTEYEDMLRRAGFMDAHLEVCEFRTDSSNHRGGHDRPLLITARKPC